LSTEPRPIKVANTAPSETTKANEIAIKTATTGKVTAVVAVFSKRKIKLLAEMRSLLTQRRKVPIFWRKIPVD
jgi:hypothetical protein